MIKELGMPQGEFWLTLLKRIPMLQKLNGKDKIEFLISANSGAAT